jgi:uncharacterized protein
MEQSLYITNRFGEKLETVVRKPDGNGKFPAIIFVAGFGADLHETFHSHDTIAKRLVDAGFLTVQFSFAGRGNSEGNYGEMTVLRQAQQIEGMIAWAKNNPDIDGKRIGIYAMSFGVPSTLGANLNDVKTLCLASGAYFPEKYMPERFRKTGVYNPSGISWRKASTTEIFRLGPKFWQDLNALNFIESVKRLITPVIMIHGDQDFIIPVAFANEVFAVIGSQKKKLKIFQGGDHGIVDVPRPMREEFLKLVVEWFRETL